MLLTKNYTRDGEDVLFSMRKESCKEVQELSEKYNGTGGVLEIKEDLNEVNLRISRDLITEDFLKSLFYLDKKHIEEQKGTLFYVKKLKETIKGMPKKESIEVYNASMLLKDYIYDIEQGTKFLNEDTRTIDSIQNLPRLINSYDINTEEGQARLNYIIKYL